MQSLIVHSVFKFQALDIEGNPINQKAKEMAMRALRTTRPGHNKFSKPRNDTFIFSDSDNLDNAPDRSPVNRLLTTQQKSTWDLRQLASKLRYLLGEALEVRNMENEKDRFGDTMRLVERAKEDIYFADQDRQVLEKLRSQLRKVETLEAARHCPKCPGKLEGYTFEGYALDRCHECGGIWLDRGELEAIVKKISRGPLGSWLDRLTEKIK